MDTPKKLPPYIVRSSTIHGKGVFARRPIRKNAFVIEYKGARIPAERADEATAGNEDDPFHTFLFETSEGVLIDAGRRGNSARWINHSCQPNCEAREDDEGRILIYAIRGIRTGEELTYDYRLNVEGRVSKRLLAQYPCHCQAPRCRKTLLRVKRTRRPKA